MKKIRCLAIVSALFGWFANPVRAEMPIGLSIVKETDGSHSVQAWFMVESSTATVWNTLSDYNSLATFVPSIRHSERLPDEGQNVYVAQTMNGQVGPFHKEISLRLQIKESEPTRIDFRDTLHHSFKYYAGSWEIASWDNGLAVTYKLRAQPNFFAPDFIIDGVFRRDVLDLIERIRGEIERRNKHV